MNDDETVGTLQAGDPAGDEPTSENSTDDDLSSVELDNTDDQPDNGDELPDDELEDDQPAGELARARREAGRYRRQVRDLESERDDLAASLWRERVAALGVLADPDDLELDLDALHDPARLRELADELVTARPHLRSRRIRERAGQGEGRQTDAVSLAAILNRGA